MTGKRIGIIDYGCGNLLSLHNAINRLNFDVDIVTQPEDVSNYNKLILPGVGAFDTAANKLYESGFTEKIKNFANNDQNLLIGICVGMQLLCKGSEESKENLSGLEFFDLEVRLLKRKHNMRLPNMGWSSVRFEKENFSNLNGDYYFVHSYAVPYSHISFAVSQYGDEKFSAAIYNGKKIFGFQFHPEKSHKLGLELLSKVLNIG